MESPTPDGMSPAPDRTSCLSASATVVNSPNTPQFPPCTAHSDTDSIVESSFSSDEDEDGGDESEHSVQGWPQLAQLMASTPDFAAFPRFRDLNVKSLLYYQCELNILREKLNKLEHRDKAENKSYAEYAEDLIDEGTSSEQFQTMSTIRKTLNAYNKALLQYSQICALPEPEPFNMRTLRKWLRNEDCGNFQIRDRNGAVNTWGKVRENPDECMGSLWAQFRRLLWGIVWTRPADKCDDLDLALTAPHKQVDGLTHWVASELIPFQRALRRHRNERKKGNELDVEKTAEKKSRNKTEQKPASTRARKIKQGTLVSWSENSALKLTSSISTVVACLLPVIAISVLSQLHGLKALLLCLTGFSFIFAVGLIALTQGTSKRTEIFGATAAFSAVMVVFISIPPAPVIVMPPGSAMPSISPSPVLSM